MATLDYQEAVHRLRSCEALKGQGRDQLLRGANGKQAVPGLNPNRITPEYLEPFVVEMQRVIRQLEETVAEYGEPGDNLIGEWYWAGVDDIKRLRARTNFYRQAVDYAKTLEPTEQRLYLYENVFLPVFYGSRHKNVADIESPWIHTLSDFCEPARIYKNYVYAIEANDAQTGLWKFITTIWDVVVGYFRAMGELVEQISSGVGKIAEAASTVVKGLGQAAMPVGIILAGVGIYMLVKRHGGASKAA
jgi:hypothetical protein